MEFSSALTSLSSKSCRTLISNGGMRCRAIVRSIHTTQQPLIGAAKYEAPPAVVKDFHDLCRYVTALQVVHERLHGHKRTYLFLDERTALLLVNPNPLGIIPSKLYDLRVFLATPIEDKHKILPVVRVA